MTSNFQNSLQKINRLQSFIALLILCIVLTILTDKFFTPDNGLNVLRQVAVNICISVGIFNRSGNYWQFRVKSFYGDDEKILLDEFITMLNRHFDEPDNLLCAHNGKEFDFPYLCRRMLINGLEIPSILNIAGKRASEMTMDNDIIYICDNFDEFYVKWKKEREILHKKM